jgi:hypothetical protein
MEKITWFEMNRSDAGKPFVSAYAGEKPIFTHPVTTIYELYTWACKVGSEGANLLVAETDKKVIPKVSDYGAQPNPDLTEYIPFATVAKAKMPQRSLEKPKYLIIHWTAGDPGQNGQAGIQEGANNGFTYLFLEGDGDLWQGAPTKAGGYHVGTASVSSFDCLGVEVACAGRLEKIGDLYVPWFAKNTDGSVNKARCIPKEQVIYDIDGIEDDESFEGYYQLYTPEQMKTLMRLSLYFVQELGGAPENILGHDMVARKLGRKVDPGFSVGEGGMTQFRKNVVAALKQGLRWDSI